MDPEELERLRCNPDMNFLVLLAFAFKKAKRDSILSAKEAVAIVVADTMRGNCIKTRGLSLNLLKNFSEGYRNAIKKYGEIVAAVKEYYGDKALVEYPILDMSCIDSESIYFFNCIEPTKTKGGYFGTVYLYMKDDFEDPDVYSTNIEILFSETAPDVGDYDIWDSYARDSDTSRVVITVEPDHVNVDYTPEDDARHFPVMTEDADRIKSFVETLISHFILE